jgi:hypothetical protein
MLRSMTATLSEAARAFADGDIDLLPSALAAGEAGALVALLVERGDAARLQRLGESADKGLAKQARRALHLLRTRGVAVPADKPREFRVRGPYAAADEPSLASRIDGFGERLVWLVRAAPEGFHVFQAQTAESRGLVGFQHLEVARKQWRQHAHDLIDDAQLTVARVPSSYARALIEEAYQRTIAQGRGAPDSFVAARLDLGHYEPMSHAPADHPGFQLAPPEPLAEARARLAELHALPAIASWLPDEEALQKLDLEVGNVLTSRLVMEPALRRERLEGAIERVAEQALTPTFRARLAERLRETAYLLALRGALADARLVSTAAVLTADPNVGAADNPFVRRLFNKMIDFDKALATDEEPPSPSSPLLR